MNSGLDFSLTFRRTLRYIEWLLVATFVLSYGSDILSSSSPIVFWRTVACLSGFVGLSWTLPVQRPAWQQQIYLLFGILLSLLIRSPEASSWDFFVYFYVAKSCFLLDRRSLIAFIIGVMVLNVSLFYWNFPSAFQIGLTHMMNLSFSQRLWWQFTLQYAVGSFTILAFVVYLSRAIITEQRLRHRAEGLMQQVETLAATLERTRIARDIHDSLGHLLTDLNARLAVAQALRDRDPIEASQAVDMAKLLASQSITEVKRSLRLIRRSDFDLNQALTTLMEQLRNHDLSVQWDINLPSLPLSSSHHLYCIVREGLINIQKHSHASEVHLRSWFTDCELFLELEDNGQGFDSACSRDGFGLKGMKERVQILNGKLMINSTLGSGTHIQVSFLYDSPADC
jgi:signal transduction histidine kinase